MNGSLIYQQWWLMNIKEARFKICLTRAPHCLSLRKTRYPDIGYCGESMDIQTIARASGFSVLSREITGPPSGVTRGHFIFYNIHRNYLKENNWRKKKIHNDLTEKWLKSEIVLRNTLHHLHIINIPIILILNDKHYSTSISNYIVNCHILSLTKLCLCRYKNKNRT